ncbi:MAG: hypothetical protein ACKOET_05170 [Verrucomicrobiota bacterium]
MRAFPIVQRELTVAWRNPVILATRTRVTRWGVGLAMVGLLMEWAGWPVLRWSGPILLAFIALLMTERALSQGFVSCGAPPPGGPFGGDGKPGPGGTAEAGAGAPAGPPRPAFEIVEGGRTGADRRVRRVTRRGGPVGADGPRARWVQSFPSSDTARG